MVLMSSVTVMFIIPPGQIKGGRSVGWPRSTCSNLSLWFVSGIETTVFSCRLYQSVEVFRWRVDGNLTARAQDEALAITHLFADDARLFVNLLGRAFKQIGRSYIAHQCNSVSREFL